MKPTLTTREHYDRLAESGHGRNDPPVLQEYMARWDGPLFFEALGDLTGKDLLEVGVGTGRIASQVLQLGCGSLTGLDISLKTITATKVDLAGFNNLELLNSDIIDFVRAESFDLALSVLTFMHIHDKPLALKNIVNSLRPGGSLILSIDNPSDSIDCGIWTVDLYPWSPMRYVEVLVNLGCIVDPPVPLIDSWIATNGEKSETYGQQIATLIKAEKRGS